MATGIPFHEPGVPRLGPMGGAEPEVNFFLQSTREIAVAARTNVNLWYSRISDPTLSLLKRLRDDNSNVHRSALDELFVNELLRRQFWRIEYEEELGAPDFRLYDTDSYLAGLEVLSLFGRSDWEAEHYQHARIADELNRRLVADRWFIHFEIIHLDREPPIRKLADWVQRTTRALAAEKISVMHDEPIPPATFASEGVLLKFDFIPRTSTGELSADRIVGMGALTGGFVNSGRRLKVALTGKAGSKYKLLGGPYAPCVVLHDFFCSDEQVLDALYGTEQIELASMKWQRASNGLFGLGKNGGKNQRVSCVYVVKNWLPWAPDEVTISRFDNPFCAAEYPEPILQPQAWFRRVLSDNGSIHLDWQAEI
ncbi:hypothetical protein [Actinoplanes friuliensis]|uniref:hypothetical protein n=1 Tax=Actinoplanes friuliensis TaxID=196914 RepID=UPI0011DD4139|nr:hypothetical protein [Actinoplanes friuliensis]